MAGRKGRRNGNVPARNGNGNGNGRRRGQPRRRMVGGMRARGDRVLAQGVGATTAHAFEGSGRSANNSAGCNTLAVWDAKLPHHLPLPRAVGPYTTIRTTRRFSDTTECLMFGAFYADYHQQWSNVAAISCGNGQQGNPINQTDASYTHVYPMSGLGSACTVCPAACTLQIMNPNPLQTTSGIIYGGVSNTQLAFSGDSTTWEERFDQFVEFQNPRLMAAAKLALRGVQINSYPLNMSACSDFTNIDQDNSDQSITWDSAQGGLGPLSNLNPRGWAPIVVYNPSGVNLEYLVTMEWRVRFDLSHPASASHTHKNVASDGLWNKLMKTASALGNGVHDIADAVASAGQAYQKFRPIAPLPLIVD